MQNKSNIENFWNQYKHSHKMNVCLRDNLKFQFVLFPGKITKSKSNLDNSTDRAGKRVGQEGTAISNLV